MADVPDVPQELVDQAVEALSREFVDYVNSQKSFSSEDRKAALDKWRRIKMESLRAWNKANPEVSSEKALEMRNHILRPPRVVAVEMRSQIVSKLDSLDRSTDERVDLTPDLAELNRFCDEWCTWVPRISSWTLRRIARAHPSYERSASQEALRARLKAAKEGR